MISRTLIKFNLTFSYDQGRLKRRQYGVLYGLVRARIAALVPQMSLDFIQRSLTLLTGLEKLQDCTSFRCDVY
jgi:hypothetical protein